jgi:hypothetical protein
VTTLLLDSVSASEGCQGNWRSEGKHRAGSPSEGNPEPSKDHAETIIVKNGCTIARDADIVVANLELTPSVHAGNLPQSWVRCSQLWLG